MKSSTRQELSEPGSAPASYVEVAFNLSGRDTYTYSVPSEFRDAITVGTLVRAPLGERIEIGCVVAQPNRPIDVEIGRVRPITGVASPEYIIGEELLQLARFISNYYFCHLGEALAAISVVGFQDIRTQRTAQYRLRSDWRGFITSSVLPLKKNQAAACEALEKFQFPADTKTELSKIAHCTTATITRLIELGVIEEDILAPPFFEEALQTEFDDHLNPTREQADALARINKTIDDQQFNVFLLHGITGSGKTEIYLQAMAHALHAGKSALCLVPEISLTPQTLERFERRFRQEIGVFHSQLTRRAKLQLYRKIQEGKIRVVIGARSAVFAPIPNLGIIVLDEEHDHSYKQSETPRYHARDMAVVRAQRLKIPVILGSATPSLESYHNAKMGKYTLLHLSNRAAGAELPPVRVIDLATEATEQASAYTFSAPLITSMRDRLAKGEQSILFLNRRGFSNFLFCPSCKWVARCDEDDVAMTVHRKNPAKPGIIADELDLFSPRMEEKTFILRCHFCGANSPAPAKCPNCDADGLMTVGAGTQRIEQELQSLFPDARLLRMDYDSTGGREGFLRAWKQMVEGEADIILGTQMIAKGLHLERVTLVGIVLADIGLFLPDFRADERTFQLLTQVAGRAGRITAGEVLLQTFMPHHTAIRFATSHDYVGFFESEIKRRRQWGFPPFRRMIAITLSDVDRERAFKTARLLSYILSRCRSAHRQHSLAINGPTIAPISRLGGRYRYRILLRGDAQAAVAKLLRVALSDSEWRLPSSTRLTIDVDPVDLL